MNARRSNPKAEQRGFTLIEMTVAVGLVAIMSSILYGALTVSLRAQTETERVADRYQTARAALGRMSHELSTAFLSKHRSEEKLTKTYFKGRRDRVEFTYLGHLRMVSDTRESDQGAVSYYLENDDDNPGQKALLRREKVVIDDRPDKEGRVEKLAENVQSIAFEYYEPEDEEWRDDWDAEPDDTEVDLTGTTEGQILDAVEDLSGKPQEFILPARIRIHMVLRDEKNREYEFETQTECPMRHPFSW